MYTIDTNVLVRILIDDKRQPNQVKLARKLASKQRKFFVPTIVQAELVWVLDQAYGINKDEIMLVLQHLFESEAYILENDTSYEFALKNYSEHNVDFSDCLILAESEANNHQVITFDKKFSRLSNCVLLT